MHRAGSRLAVLAGVLATVTGCQTAGSARDDAGAQWIAVEPATEGWLQTEARVCVREGSGQAMECRRHEDQFTEALAAASQDGMEVPAYATQERCVQGQTVRVSVQGGVMTVRMDRIECRKIDAASTRGTGWHHSGRMEICDGEGRCTEAGRGSTLRRNAAWMGRLLLAGYDAPTFRSRETCEETLSYVITALLEGMDSGGMEIMEQVLAGVPEKEIEAEIERRHEANLRQAETDPFGTLHALVSKAEPVTDLKAKVRCSRYRQGGSQG